MEEVRDLKEPLSNGKKGYTEQACKIFRQNNFSEDSIRKIRSFFKREKDIVEFLNSIINEGLEKEILEKFTIGYIDSYNGMTSKTKYLVENLI